MPQGFRAPHLVQQHFLSPEEHSDLLAYTVASEPRFKAAGVAGTGVNIQKRQCAKLSDIGPSRDVFLAKAEAQYTSWLEQLRVTPFTLDKLETEIVAYADGAHFAFHIDAALGKDVPARNRRLTAVYYFFQEPQHFTGGDLRLYDLGAHAGSEAFIAIPPAQNTMVVSPSWVGHDVTPVRLPSNGFTACRFAVNCWLHQPRQDGAKSW